MQECVSESRTRLWFLITANRWLIVGIITVVSYILLVFFVTVAQVRSRSSYDRTFQWSLFAPAMGASAFRISLKRPKLGWIHPSLEGDSRDTPSAATALLEYFNADIFEVSSVSAYLPASEGLFPYGSDPCSLGKPSPTLSSYWRTRKHERA